MKPNEVVQGDVGPYEFLLEDESGPVRIPPGSTVEWLQGPLRTDVILPSYVSAGEVLDDGTDALKGRGRLIAVHETSVPGVYGVQFRITYPGGAQAVFPSSDPEELLVRRLVAQP